MRTTAKTTGSPRQRRKKRLNLTMQPHIKARARILAILHGVTMAKLVEHMADKADKLAGFIS